MGKIQTIIIIDFGGVVGIQYTDFHVHGIQKLVKTDIALCNFFKRFC